MPFHIKHSSDPSKGLCTGCKNAHIRTDETGPTLVLCQALYPPLQIQKPVTTCSEFKHRDSLNLDEMREIAWTVRIKGKSFIGFETPEDRRKRIGSYSES